MTSDPGSSATTIGSPVVVDTAQNHSPPRLTPIDFCNASAKQVTRCTFAASFLIGIIRPRISEHSSTVPPCIHPCGRGSLRRSGGRQLAAGLGFEPAFEDSARFRFQVRLHPQEGCSAPPGQLTSACHTGGPVHENEGERLRGSHYAAEHHRCCEPGHSKNSWATQPQMPTLPWPVGSRIAT